MSQRYYGHGRFSMNIRNNVNYTVLMRNTDARVNKFIARQLNVLREYEETDKSIKTSERNKVYLEQNIQTLKNNLPYCRDSDFNQNENSRDESQKCCPTGWNRFPDQTGELLPD